MSDLINGRTPEEIKASLEMCSEICFGRSDCPYYDGVNERCQTKLTADALALIERLEAERDAALAKVPKWISVKERLPDIGDNCLVYMPEYDCCEAGEYTKHREWLNIDDWHMTEYVTHWMPLPEPPKEDARADARKPV